VAATRGQVAQQPKKQPSAVASARKTRTARERLRLGPPTNEKTVPRQPRWDPTARRQPGEVDLGPLVDEAAKTGELYVNLPTRVLRLPDGGEIRVPERYEHPLMGRLRDLATDFVEHAKANANDEAVAIGHILSATLMAIDGDDLGALNEENGPHRWARRYISRDDDSREPSLRSIPVRTGHSLPGIEDPKRRVLSLRQLSGGFAIVERLVALLFGIESRAGGEDLDAIADCMRDNLPSLSSLREDEATVRARVRAGLEVAISKNERDIRSHDEGVRRRAIESVVEALVVTECRRSKVDPRKALAFLKKRKI